MELSIMLESVLHLCSKSQCLAARQSRCREIHLNPTLPSLDLVSTESLLHEPWLEILRVVAYKTSA